MARPCIVFDIDGTLSNNEHRLKFIQGDIKDWDAFYDRIAYDTPNESIVRLAQDLYKDSGHELVMITGRPERTRVVTLDWMELRGVPCDALFMRSNDDHRDDVVVKSELLDEAVAAGWHPWLAVEDRSRVVKMWRDRGITCLQCADGDF